MLSAFIKQHNLPEEFKHTVEQFYKPLADRIFSQYTKNKAPYFVGINGCQGSGKSTLTDFIATYLTTQYHQFVIAFQQYHQFVL